MFLKFIKFGLVGFIGLIIDFSITYFLKEIIKIHRYLANSIGFIIAASSNYYFNRVWTFESRNQHIIQEYSVFIIVSLIGLFINNLFLFLFESKLNIKFYKAKFLAIIVTTAWNFFVNYFYTFAFLQY